MRFKVRVKGSHESYDDPSKVTVSFTGRPKAKKTTKKDEPMAIGESPSFSLPMSKEEAAMYPIGSSCTVCVETCEEEEEEEEEEEPKPSPSSRIRKAMRESVKK